LSRIPLTLHPGYGCRIKRKMCSPDGVERNPGTRGSRTPHLCFERLLDNPACSRLRYWTLPPGDVDYAHRWRLIKARFSSALADAGKPFIRNARGEYNVWQRRFWEHTVRDEKDLQAHTDYIHYNPVKHSLVTRVCDWPYSSFHRFVRLGWLSPDWAGDPNLLDGPMGE